jgi:hypothetical protein
MEINERVELVARRPSNGQVIHAIALRIEETQSARRPSKMKKIEISSHRRGIIARRDAHARR